jgi:predicted AlkP superfamily phosphohydrolase/phosphomutase
VTLFYLNVLQHFFWNDKPTQRAWELIDEWVGKISEYEDTNLVLMSDHGCGPTHTEFYINEWLSENGYLTEQRTVEDYLTAVGLTRENALNMAKQLGIVGLLEQLVPEKIQQLVPQSAGAKRGRKLDKVVLNETKAVASGQGPVYLNPSFDVDTVANSLIDELQKTTDSTGQPLFEAVHRASDVYNGSFIRRGPEIVIEQASGVHINDGLGGGKIMTDPDRWAAENTRSGIFVASGPDFDPQGHLAEISITDIMPTILASQNVPIPTDIDGEILPIADQSVGTQSPIKFEDASQTDHDTGVTDRLKQLGYME